MLEQIRASPHVAWVHTNILAILPYMLPILVTAKRFPHIEGIGIVIVVSHHAAIDRIPALHQNMPGESYRRFTYPIFLYSSCAVLFSARTNRSTNHALLASHDCSKLSVSLVAWPSLRALGATVSAVTWPCQGR